MVEIAVGGSGELEGSEADVVQGLVINAVGFISVFHQLVDRECGVVGLDNGVGNLGGGDNGVGVHNSVGVLLADLGDEQGSHSRSGSTSEGVCQLKSLN